MLDPQADEQRKNQNGVRRILKKFALRLISILGRRVTGRNPWIAKLNSIDNAYSKIRYVQKECQRQAEKFKDFSDFLNAAGVASHKWLGDGPDSSFVAMCISYLSFDQINEPSIRRATRLNIPLPASFRVCLTLRSKKKQLFRLNEWRLNDKRAGLQYARRLGVRTPELLQDDIPFDEIIFKNCTVIKPAFGSASTGVYIIDSAGEIICVKEAKTLPNEESLKKHAYQLIKEGLVSRDKWLVEELIVGLDGQGAAADIKCYTFYGRTELVRYIQRIPRFESSWFGREGNRLDEVDGRLNARIAEAVRLADRIGATVPAPFLRIDLLEGEDGEVFGEFTPRPGSYCDHDAETDYRLGVAFLDAEERLLADLLNGKKFPEYAAEFSGELGYSDTSKGSIHHDVYLSSEQRAVYK